MSGLRNDAAYVTVSGGEVVEREIGCVGDPTTLAAIAAVTNTTPNAGDYGLVVRVIGGASGGGAVYGPSNTGVVPSNPPIVLGGVDAGGLLRAMRTDASGYPMVMVTNGTQNMPTGDVAARAIYIRNTDGTNSAAVKAASTPAAAADPALVMAMSPNLPVPTMSNINSAATTNLTSVKASAGTVFNIIASNTGAGAAYVKLYNKASAPVVASDVPVITLTIPSGGVVCVNPHMIGLRFTAGIALAITGAAVDNDATAVALGQVKVMTAYI